MEQQGIYRTAQEYLTEEEIPGWLVYDYRHANPVFWLVIFASGHVTRPCYFYLPAQGEPSLLVHHVDAGKFANFGVNVTVYSSRESMLAALRGLLSGVSLVAMEYSPENTLLRVSRVDAGTIELVRSLGPQVVSSADLMQYATHQWTPEPLADHLATADKLGLIVNEAFAYAGKHLAEGINEFQVAEFIRNRFAEEAIESPDGPIVAVNSNASDPHYEPSAVQHSPIKQGDWLLIDFGPRVLPMAVFTLTSPGWPMLAKQCPAHASKRSLTSLLALATPLCSI